MNTICPSLGLAGDIEQLVTLGESLVSRNLLGLFNETRQHFMEPVSRGKMLNELWNCLERIESECKEYNWDGYGASPLLQKALMEIKIILRELPLCLDRPQIVPEPSGAIGLEWRRGGHQIFILSVDGSETISYAAILHGGSKKYGVERFTETLPNFIKDHLWEHFSETD